MRKGGETGGRNRPGTRELDRVGWEWQGRTTGRGHDPSGRSCPHPSRTLSSQSLRCLARPPHPAPATGAEFTTRTGLQRCPRGSAVRSVSAPPPGGGTPAPRCAPHPGGSGRNPWRPAPPRRPAPGRPGWEGAGGGGGGDAPPPARGLARAHPSRPRRAARGLAGPRGCSWALLETSNAGSDSSPTARMQKPPLPPPQHPTPPPSAEPERRGRASERAREPASRGAGDGQGCSVSLSAPHAPPGQTHGQVRRGARRAPRRGRGWARRWAPSGRGSGTHQHPNSDSHTLAARTWTGRQRHARSPGN